jgi:hypothetical protein
MVVLATGSEHQMPSLGHASDESALSGPKTSEKRRAQNRAAQKTYREKRKRKLQELERLAASAGLISPPESQHHSPEAATAGSEPSADLPASNDGAAADTLMAAMEDEFDLDAIIDPAWLADDAQGSSPALPFDTLDPPQFAGLDSTMPQHTSLTLRKSCIGQLSAVPGQEWASQLASPDSIVFADPLMNTLHLHTASLEWAFCQNLFQLGIADTSCDDNTISHFYRADAGSAPDPDAIVKSVQDTFAYLKRDLRPTREQITISHPAYLDALPFPCMRARLIELSATDSPMFDQNEMMMDLAGGGLVCWGSVSTRPGAAPAGGGAPWDSRSWEAKTWFLAKWSFIVGGDDSELSRSSEWWREMRGIGQGVGF